MCNALKSSMGNAEGKPLDASDITDLEAAKAEVKYREGLAPINCWQMYTESRKKTLLNKFAFALSQIVKIRESLRKRRQVTGANFPKNFRKVPSHMMRVLTQEDYEKYMNLVGPRGYHFDACIQCGSLLLFALLFSLLFSLPTQCPNFRYELNIIARTCLIFRY